MGKINRFEDIEAWQKARCLSIHPEIYGKPLLSPLKSYRKLRVGEYGIICKIPNNKIYILGIINRKDIYPEVEKVPPER